MIIALTVLILLLGIVGAILFFQPRWVFKIIMKIAPGVIYFSQTSEPIIAITIDDGPHAHTTSKILEVLERYQAHATFFLISNRTQGNEDIVSAILEKEHELGNHMIKDERSINLPSNRFEEELLEADSSLTKLIKNNISLANPIVNRVRWFRPGGGWYSAKMLQIANKHSYQCVLGSIFPYDTHIPSSWFAARQILSNLRPGAIIVLHDSGREGKSGEWGERTASTLEKVLPEIKRQGYQTVTLSEMFPFH